MKKESDKKPLTGIIKTTGKGMGFVTVEGIDEAIVIEPEFVNHALNGDEVEIILTGYRFKVQRGRPGQKTNQEQGEFKEQTGQVVKILNRAKKQFVGILVNKDLQINGQGGLRPWLIPDDRRMYVPIMVTGIADTTPAEAATPPNLGGDGGGINSIIGKKVLVKMTAWEKQHQFPTGEVVQVLGEKGDNETEIQAIILDRGIDTNFPPEVEREAEQISKTEWPLKESEIAKRKDFRTTTTMTIDPFDAKDFDDAISFKDLGQGKYEVGVHIADVSYYVREGTALDREARNRATSIYLVDRTIPMLPEVLSNDLCSLNPNVDRFAFSAVFVMDMNGTVHERWFGRTVIHSNKRFTYENAQATIDAGTGELATELVTLNKIAKKLMAEKFAKGAVEFEQEEVKFKLDEHGKPLDVYKKERLDTHKLVEEFMLLANREVAEFIFKHQEKTDGVGIYRIHDLPDPERIQELSLFLKALGYDLPVKQGKVSSQDINKLMQQIEGKPEESLIKTATIRSMAKAIYSPNNIGHFGLAFEYYTHFTSPIRRYPDLVVHRVLHDILTGDKNKAKDEFKQMNAIATHSTEKEIAAAEAERASIKLKQVEYMAQFIGEEFDGVISGVTEWGLYIEDARTKCEGMVPLREIGTDFYVFNKRTYSIKGEKTKKEFRLGDKVRYRVVKADLDAKTLDYKLV